MNTANRLAATLIVTLLVGCERPDADSDDAAMPFDLIATPVGDVSFPSGCEPDAARYVERGVALLHHMMYDEARIVFSMADDVDPDCALAYWGQAMVLIHPLWPDAPSTEDLRIGNDFVRRSLETGGHDERENAYLQTTRAYFEDSEQLSESERLARFEKAWRTVYEGYPGDVEARAFYSLALRATTDISDATRNIPREAGRLAESVLADMPNHPGGHHYLIHAYDFPELADKALATADHYGEITPRVPHASHMMTHIYTRLGLWEKAIEWNRISADTAWEMCVASGEINLHYTHALDYLAYAHLQRADDGAALDIIETAEQLQPPFGVTNRDASAYALAALPARYALERQDWQAAANLQPRQPATFPWDDSFDAYVAITHFARAIGLARLGQPEAATDDITMLNTLVRKVAEFSPYWAEQVQIQELAARAWQDYASGDVESGIDRMWAAAAKEAATEKHAVTPGEVLPAAELYGDMLLDAGRDAEALAAYRAALERGPGRFNSLLGAARAAVGMGDAELAAEYYGSLLELARHTDARPGNIEAIDYLNGR